MDIKIMAVTIHKSAMVILGLSPPSSTTLRIRVAAIPMSARTWMKVLPSMADVGENAFPTTARAAGMKGMNPRTRSGYIRTLNSFYPLLLILIY